MSVRRLQPSRVALAAAAAAVSAFGSTAALSAQPTAELPVAVSALGLPGLFKIPTATAFPSGWLDVSMNNVPAFEVIGNRRDVFAWQANLQFAIGLWDRVVIGGRGAEARATESTPIRVFAQGGRSGTYYLNHITRDLSANVQLLLLREQGWLPALSIGWHDFGGASQQLSRRFVTTSKSVGKWGRASLGFGDGRGPLSEWFGGLEVAPFDGAVLSAEYDGERFNGSLRAYPLPERWSDRAIPRLWVQALWAESDGFYGGVGVQVPLDRGAVQDDAPGAQLEGRSVAEEPTSLGVESLVRRGFEDVRVDESAATIEVSYENRVFNQSSLDGIAAGLRLETGGTGTGRALGLTSRRYGIDLVRVVMRSRATTGEATPRVGALRPVEAAWAPGAGSHEQGASPARYRTDLVVTPSVSTIAFSDIGILDARLGVEPTLRTRWGYGVESVVGAQIPLFQTQKFGFMQGPLPDPDLSLAMLSHVHQLGAFAGSPLLGRLSVGYIGADAAGLRQELLYPVGGGRLILEADLAAYDRDPGDFGRTYAVGGVLLALPEVDAVVRLQAGRYFDQDVGFEVEAERFVGDTGISLSVRRSGVATLAGIGISLPLSPRRDRRPSMLRPRGPSAWSYRQQTVILREHNEIFRQVARSFQGDVSLLDLVLDRGRMTPIWIRSHLSDPRHWRP